MREVTKRDNLLKEIADKKLPENESTVNIRRASRAVLFDENNKIPILFVSKYNYHKLPGGGIKEKESKEKALERECLEEVGCEIEINGEIGKIIEFRSKWNMRQISYCYYGKIISKGAPNFTKKEIDNGFQIIWMSLSKAIMKIKNDNPNIYEERFIQERDYIFLKQAEQIVLPQHQNQKIV